MADDDFLLSMPWTADGAPDATFRGRYGHLELEP